MRKNLTHPSEIALGDEIQTDTVYYHEGAIGGPKWKHATVISKAVARDLSGDIVIWHTVLIIKSTDTSGNHVTSSLGVAFENIDQECLKDNGVGGIGNTLVQRRKWPEIVHHVNEDLEWIKDQDIIQGMKSVDPDGGLPIYSWITGEMNQGDPTRKTNSLPLIDSEVYIVQNQKRLSQGSLDQVKEAYEVFKGQTNS